MSDRKYGQRGYQDSERGERRKEGGDRDRPKPSGPRVPDPAKGPKGRGLGAPTATVFKCAACGGEQSSTEVAAEAVCAKCSADLHTCTNCGQFDSAAPNQCRHGGATMPDGRAIVRILKKRTRNECTLFVPRLAAGFAKEPPRSRDDPRAAFDALFKL